MVLVLMGVSGAGKTTIGRALSAELGWSLLDADVLHPPENIAKMRRGDGLSDEDRALWLLAIRARIDDYVASSTNLIVACSALKKAYRDVLGFDRPEIKAAYLRVPKDVLAVRLENRAGHFAGTELLDSQLAALEEPDHVLVVDASRPVNEVVLEIVETLVAR